MCSVVSLCGESVAVSVYVSPQLPVLCMGGEEKTADVRGNRLDEG